MSCDASDSSKAEVCDAGPSMLVDEDVRLHVCAGCKSGDSSFGKFSYPFQISVDNAKVVHILQATRNIG